MMDQKKDESSDSYLGGKSIHEVETNANKIYKLSSNENLLGPSPKAVEAIRQHAGTLNIYPDRTDKRLCVALAAYYDDRIGVDQFFGANSGSECIEYVVRAFVATDDECIISTPAFGVYKKFIKWSGGKVVDVPLEGQDYKLNVRGILDAITDRTKLIFLTSPNNPTGTYIKKAQVDQLIENVPDHVVVVYDEVYFLFADAPDYVTAMEYVEQGCPVIGINSFSKSHGLAGLRLGYCYSTREIINRLKKIKRPFLVNSLGIEAGIAAIGDVEFVKRSVAAVRQSRVNVCDELKKIGVTHWPTQANFIQIRPEMDEDIFEQRMLDEGIMVRPVSGFGAEGCVRVTIGTDEANKAFIDALKKVMA